MKGVSHPELALQDLVELIDDKLALKAGINNISGELADNLEVRRWMHYPSCMSTSTMLGQAPMHV